MIYTCTLNPAVDFYVQVPEFSIGRINQGELLRFVPGGKGLNVSMVLKQLGVENIALGFVGGKFGKLLQELLIEYNITTDFVEIKGETRLNVKIRDELETDINLVGPEVTKSEVDKLLSKLDIINPNDYLVVGGKALKTSESIISMIGSYAKKKDLNLIVDMSGNDLETMLNYQPLLIKPNKEELETLIKRKLDNLSEIETVCKYLIIKYHITYVLVSLGKDGAI
ncbi:MAG: 1-phosphofructokinase family hexose kinase, partial [Bacilli bacterium]|nr:1-phosphofructokinase family hexose kinase [Bacilli bacterium]